MTSLVKKLILLAHLLTCACDDGTSKWTGNSKKDFCERNDCEYTDIKFDENTYLLHLIEKGNAFSSFRIYSSFDKDIVSQPCVSSTGKSDLCLSWDNKVVLEVNKIKIRDTPCFRVNLRTLVQYLEPKTCLNFEDAFWYGGAEQHTQRWPLNDVTVSMQPYVSQDLVVNVDAFGNVLEPYWISSDGVGIFVDDLSPLHVSINAGRTREMCLKAKFENPHQPRHSEHTLLNYTVCKADDILQIHKVLSGVLFDRPVGAPDLRMLRSPIWSTWARYKTAINQSKVIQFGQEITQHGFSNSQLEIDDMYSSKYGDFDFDSEKFPDPSYMMRTLKEEGFRTTVWVTPFANVDSQAFIEGVEKGYWLKDIYEQVPALVKWWQGIGAILDVTNNNASDWFVERLKEMKSEYMIESFKFDAGEMTFLPSSYKPHLGLGNPGFFSAQYVETVSRLGNAVEVRCGYKSQRYPVFVRMADKQSVWGYENGLKTLIPTALTFSILGYPYILPDMIGGNGYGEVFSLNVVLPERELYIRWLQITTFLPSMQFSFVPWDYDEEVVQIARKMVDIHENIVTPILMRCTRDVIDKGYPLIRPLWWIDPSHPDAQKTDSQFLVCEELMVAPIVMPLARSRDIFIPNGKWYDELRDKEVDGPRWLTHYKIDLNEVATFKKLIKRK